MIVRYTCWDPLSFLYVKLYPRYQNHARESEAHRPSHYRCHNHQLDAARHNLITS